MFNLPIMSIRSNPWVQVQLDALSVALVVLPVGEGRALAFGRAGRAVQPRGGPEAGGVVQTVGDHEARLTGHLHGGAGAWNGRRTQWHHALWKKEQWISKIV